MDSAKGGQAMKKFQFRLQKVLRYREHMEELQRIETHRREVDLQDRLSDQQYIQDEMASNSKELVPEPGEVRRAMDIHERYRHALVLRGRYADNERKVEEAALNLHLERTRLVERSRDKKTLERLEQRKFTEWVDETQKEDQLLLDEVGLRRAHRPGQEGKILLTGILVLACIGLGVLCFSVWTSWFNGKPMEYPWLRKPFDTIAEKQVREELEKFEGQQRSRRAQRDEATPTDTSVATAPSDHESEGFKLTLQRIRQKEDMLRTKEEDLDARENVLQQGEDDFRREMNRLNNLQRRITEELTALKTLESKRTQEMSAEHKAKMVELVASVKQMSPKRAAALLFATAFPEQQVGIPPPLPVGENLEGIELVVAVMHQLPARERGAILDAMTRTAAEKAASIMERLDNVKTGLEEDRFFKQEAAKATP